MVVAATKLVVPRSRRALVPRPELVARLDTDYRVGLVSAPAGYGKTAVLGMWAAEHRQRVAWLSCDVSDAEPTRFMAGLLSALGSRWPGVADDALVLLEHGSASIIDAAVVAANELAAVDAAGIIVVDDLHLAEPTPALLTAFMDALPAGFRLVIGTRSDPPLSLARLRLHGELLDVRSADLRFDGDELSDFLQLQDVRLAGEELGRLHELTEGWPAGVQLATITLQRDAPRDRFFEAFASTDRGVGDFLLSEVLASLPLDVVEFLVQTSVLDSFDAELCRDITGIAEAGALLERLVAADLFVVPLDDRGHWYRYHHLFGSFLRARLAALGEQRRRAAHAEASSAFERRGDVGAALRHAMEAGSLERVGEIISRSIERTMSLSDGADAAVDGVRLWLHHYGAQFVESDPVKVLEPLLGLITLAGSEDAASWLERIRAAHADADGELDAFIEGVWAELHQHRGQPLEAGRRLKLALQAVNGRPPSHGLLSLLFMGIARAELNTGDLDGAIATMEHALTHPVGSSLPDDVRHPSLAAYVFARSGALTRAEELSSRACVAADALGLGGHEPGRIFAGLARLEVQLERHDDEHARDTLEELAEASTASHRLALQASVALHRARAARMLGDAVGAAASLDQSRLSFAEPDAGMLRILGEEAALQALQFEPADAARMIDQLDPDRVTTAVLRVRLALLEHDDRAAAASLAALPPPTTRRDFVERGVLLALSELERDVEAANEHLREALAAGQPERMVRSILDQGTNVHFLLKSFTPNANQERYVQQLLASAERVIAPARSQRPSGLVEPLSDREVTVLRYLCSRLTYPEIAAALYVSLNTLKSHVRSVYRKLGVGARADAITVGRSLGLV